MTEMELREPTRRYRLVDTEGAAWTQDVAARRVSAMSDDEPGGER